MRDNRKNVHRARKPHITLLFFWDPMLRAMGIQWRSLSFPTHRQVTAAPRFHSVRHQLTHHSLPNRLDTRPHEKQTWGTTRPSNHVVPSRPIQSSRSRNFPLKMPPSPKIIVLVVWFCHVFLFSNLARRISPPKEKVRSKSTSRKQNLARGWKKKTKKQETLLRNLIIAIFFPVIGVRNSSAMPTSIQAKHAEKRVIQVPLKTLKRKRHLKKEMIFGYCTYVALKKKTQLFHIKTPGATFSEKKKRENASWKKKDDKFRFKKTVPFPTKGPQTAGNPGAIEKEKAVSCDGFIDQPPERPRPVEVEKVLPKNGPPKKGRAKENPGKKWWLGILDPPFFGVGAGGRLLSLFSGVMLPGWPAGT